jgi:hypothetical protein
MIQPPYKLYAPDTTSLFVFDIISSMTGDSVLPDYLKLVMEVNPQQMNKSSQHIINVTQTRGGFVEYHWGEGTQTLSFSSVTGGFKRLYSGLSNTTNPAYGGTRRDTIAYDKFLDILALFKNNGAVYDQTGAIVYQDDILLTCDDFVSIGNFQDFTWTEEVTKPYMFSFQASFVVKRELYKINSSL